MSRFPLLAAVDVHALSVQSVASALARHGVHAPLRPLPDTPCLCFQLSRADGLLRCHVEAAAWAAVHLPELAGLDWRSMDPAIVAGLTSVERPLTFTDPALAYDHAMPMGRTACAAARLPAVRADEGLAWIEQVQGPLPVAPAPGALRGDLAVRLSLRLGTVRCAAGRLRRLARGDIVLMTRTDVRAFHGMRPLFDYLLHEESITVNQFEHPDTEALAPAASDALEVPLDIGSLPLGLQVQLCELPLTVAEISTLQPGSVLALPPGAYQQVSLLQGNVRVAAGELVQVGDALGVRLSQVPRLS